MPPEKEVRRVSSSEVEIRKVGKVEKLKITD